MSVDKGELKRRLELAREARQIAQIEGSDAAWNVFGSALFSLLEGLTEEAIRQREDLYGSWEPLERLQHDPLETRPDYPYHDATPLENEQVLAQAIEYRETWGTTSQTPTTE